MNTEYEDYIKTVAAKLNISEDRLNPSASISEENPPLYEMINSGVNGNIRSFPTLITPTTAANLLKLNNSYKSGITRNRDHVIRHVRRLADAIDQGEWKLTGETIVFSKNKTLIDGQHRLMAVILANRPIETFVTVGIDEENSLHIDAGKPRTSADRMHMMGVNDSRTISCALNFLVRASSGIFSDTRVVSSWELTDWENKFPNLEESVPFGKGLKRRYRISAGEAVGIHWILRQIDKELADEYYNALSADELPEKYWDTAVRTVRDRLLVSITSNNRVHRLNRRDKISVIVTGWNKFVTGGELKKIYIQKNIEFMKPTIDNGKKAA